MSTYIKWQIGFGVFAVVVRAIFLARNVYPRIVTTYPRDEVIHLAVQLGFLWWGVSVIANVTT